MREGRVWAEVRVVAKPRKFRQIPRIIRSIVFIDYLPAAGPRFGARISPTERPLLRSGTPKRCLSSREICPPRSIVYIGEFISLRSADAQQSIQMARRSIVYIREFFASGPPNTAPELPETPWYCRDIAGVENDEKNHFKSFKSIRNHEKSLKARTYTVSTEVQSSERASLLGVVCRCLDID